MRDRGEYALLWANGMTFSEVYDLMKADIDDEINKGWDLHRADEPIPYTLADPPPWDAQAALAEWEARRNERLGQKEVN